MALSKPQWRLNKNWLLLFAALALGVGAAYLSDRVLSERLSALDAEARRDKDMVAVVVAKAEIPRGQAIQSSLFAVRQIPREFVQSDAVTPASFESMQNQRLAVALQRGDVLLPAHSEGLGGQVFSATLTKGRRALTIEVDTVNAVSGMLRPGDHIDLIYGARGTDPGDASERSVPLLSNVRVLATDQTLTKRDDDGSGRERSFSTVTLDVSPREAQRIIVAKQSGRLTATLRHPDDAERNRTGVVTAEDLTRGSRPLAGSTVEMITGGGGGGLADVQLAKLLPALNARSGAPAGDAHAPAAAALSR
jgi:pilus assembly protein CpaB